LKVYRKYLSIPAKFFSAHIDRLGDIEKREMREVDAVMADKDLDSAKNAITTNFPCV
jgi:hypothetical protein